MITIDDEIKIGDIILPGLVQKLTINGSAIIDEVEIQGRKDKPKQAVGYENSTIKITLLLINTEGSSTYEQLAILQNAFKKTYQKKPVVYNIFNKHLSIRNITKVLFSKLNSSEDNKRDTIKVTLEFTEYIPFKIPVKRKARTKTSKAKVSSSFSQYLNNRRTGLEPPYKITAEDLKVTASNSLTTDINKIFRSPIKDFDNPTAFAMNGWKG
ncbi:hypothetical protein [Vallitalea guaymasensis]|uniref:hypothetical protein n=1 Tax=Vallitalea guaymasensis TaxID=1185412 RepID=UPI000DE2ABC0|nr:hypothetical protein [Vallitalea guaymasensis]